MQQHHHQRQVAAAAAAMMARGAAAEACLLVLAVVVAWQVFVNPVQNHQHRLVEAWVEGLASLVPEPYLVWVAEEPSLAQDRSGWAQLACSLCLELLGLMRLWPAQSDACHASCTACEWPSHLWHCCCVHSLAS